MELELDELFLLDREDEEEDLDDLEDLEELFKAVRTNSSLAEEGELWLVFFFGAA